MQTDCMMGCGPTEADAKTEKFFVLRMFELTIYGHTTDRFTRERYPEDWPHTQDLRQRGYEWGCWHSVACSDGEIGSQDPRVLSEITYEQFIAARDAGWPYLEDEGVTTYAPVSAIHVLDDDGQLKEVWNSLEGDKD